MKHQHPQSRYFEFLWLTKAKLLVSVYLSKVFGAHPRQSSPKGQGIDTKHVASLKMGLDLQNERYHNLMMDYTKCISVYLNEFTSAQELGGQLKRRDLDTVCAYELYQMKKEFLTTNVLDFSEFVKHL